MFYTAFLMPNLPRRGLELELLDTNTKAQVSMWPARREVGERRGWGSLDELPALLRIPPPEGQWEGPGGHSAPVQSPSAFQGQRAHSLKTINGRRVLSHFPSQISLGINSLRDSAMSP